MEVRKARALGFCFGVRRAIRILEQASREHGGIETLGPAVHNQQVVDRLSGMEIRVAQSLEQARGGVVAITAHGVGPGVLAEIRARQLYVVDATCPIVRRAQRRARELSRAGFGVIIFGEVTHPEVKGLLGWADSKAVAALEGVELTSFSPLPRRLGVISQTTQSRSDFAQFVGELMAVLPPRVRELRIIDTICQATQKRQEAATELAQRSQLMVVIGGRDSANTRRLAEICSTVVETHRVEMASEIDEAWLKGKSSVGVTAGASTPNEAINEVVLRLKSFGESSQAGSI